MSIRLVNPVLPRTERTPIIDPDARAYLAAVEIADGTPLEPRVRSAVDWFVLGLKRDGIWNAIKCAGINSVAKTLDGAFVPFVGPQSTNVGFTLTDYTRLGGLLSSGSKHVNTNYSGANQGRDNILMACSVTQLSATVDGAYIATELSSAYMLSNGGGLGFRVRLRQATLGTHGTLPGATFLGVSRGSAANYQWVYGAESGTQARISDTNSSTNNYLIHAVPGYSRNANARIRAWFIGDAIDLILLRNRVNDFYAAIGAAIP